MAGRQPPREDRRVIAIQMLPKAYTEIQRLKGEETWTRFIIECVLAKVGNNNTLQDELATLLQEAEVRRIKAEKPKKEKKAAKVEDKPSIGEIIIEEHEPTEAELKAIEAEQPTTERKPTAGISTPAMRQPKKGKTMQELKINKGEG